MKKNIHTRLASLVFMSIIQFTYCIAQDKLSGTSSVSPTGAAVYSVAFEAPKGVGDLKPSIGISYNSQTGNGLVGWGCNITGLSSITRGMKDWAHDNTVKGISYDTGCALYLDGKRLLLKSGTEGTDGCIYSPEGEPQTSVTLHSSLTSSNCWFEVDTSDGMVYEYGHTDGRQTISNPTAVTAWYVDKATNPLGQYISYTYQNVNLFLYPASITYGGNNSILFEYENRTDTIPFVLRDNGGYVAKRLKSVTTKAGNEIYRTYTMAYTYDGNTETHFSRLQSVTEKGEDGYSTHVLSTSWNNLSSYSPSYQETSISVPSSYSLAEYGERFLLAGDINNDGISEFIHISPVITYNSSGMNERFFYIDVYNSDIENGAVSYDHRSFSSFRDPFDFLDWSYRKGVSSIVDMNGDGINDFIIPCCDNANNNGTYTFYFKVLLGSDTNSYSTRKLFAFTNMVVGTDVPLYQVIDLDNNGKNNIILLEKNGQNGSYTLHLSESSEFCTYYQKNLTLSSAPKQLYTSDFNHDGLVDIMVVCSDGCRIFYNQGGSSLQNVFVDSSTLNTGLTNHDRMEMGDFNGDGIADFIWNDDNSGNLYFEIGSANGTYSRHLAYSLGYGVFSKNTDEGTWSCMIVDLDHDGKSDVVLSVAKYIYQSFPPRLIYNSSHSYWLLSRGTTLTKKKESSSTRPDDAKPGHWFAGDFKGQGFLEVANYGYDCYNGSNANTDPTVNVYSCSSQNISNGKIASFTDSHGRSTAFTYASLTSDLVYTKGTSEQYPLLDVAAPLCVTSQVSETGGSPISTETNYTYAGLRAHLTGRGLLGFKEMTASEAYTGKVTKTIVDTLNVNYYVPKNITTTTTQGGNTSSVSQNMTIKTYNYGNHTNYALFPTIQTDTDIYSNVSWTTRNYDMNKGILLRENKTDDGGDFYRRTTYTYGQTKIAGAWRPVTILQEQKHPDDNNTFAKQTNISYNGYGQKISVTEFSNTSNPLTTIYQYDVNGNVTSETLSGNGIGNDAVTYYQYSNDGKFLTQKSNVAGTIGYTYNAFGELTAETNLTDSSHPLTTYYYRDGFGMLTMEDKPTGERTEWERATTSNYDGAYYVISHKYGSPEVTTIYDTFGNEIYTETEGIGEVAISTANCYNNYGKLSQQERIHGDLTITDYYEYDGLGRLLNFSSTDGTETDYEYYDREIITTENGKKFTKYFDAWGNVTESTDSLSSVSYTYSSIGKPSEVECENSTISIQYDSQGNQISLNDP
ncbi:MAG: FG-GAP-like repeat-containing protein, partial [Prevotella sp.]|nr:FG-GAP-like repeat-containing protein [Prevotella sp.]